MEEDLPSSFDVLIVGTGIPESILAAAVARAGKTVLHLDVNDHYGGDWGSFNFDQLNDWAQNASKTVENCNLTDSTYSELKKNNESVVIFPRKSSTIFNVKINNYVPETIAKDIQPEVEIPFTTKVEVEIPVTTKVEVEIPVTTKVEVEIPATTKQEILNTNNDSFDIPSENIEDSELTKLESVGTEEKNPVDNQSKIKAELALQGSCEPTKWSLEELHNQRRKFNLDLSPKLLFSKGALVELLIQSNISRYAEFKCSSQILTLLEGKLMPVPCSRADVFSTKHVSIVEKRMLMKLLSFCLNFEEQPDKYKPFESKPFSAFLSSEKLTPNVSHYVIHSIAMVDPKHPTLDSLQRVQKFLQSLGRFGNSPFLFPLYGSGEMPQCFCRLCAVFGGVYCLKKSVQAIILDSENNCTACVVNDKRVDCKLLAMEYSYAPKDFLPPDATVSKISKAIFITDASIYPSEHDQLTFLRLPATDFIKNAVNVLELGPSSNICPKGLRVVYLSCQSHYESSEDDLYPAAQLLLNFSKSNREQEESSSKPNVVWALYFNQFDNSLCDLNVATPKNVFLMSTPDIEQDYETAIAQAKNIFLGAFPSEEFLPRAPDPEEIILDSDDTEKNGEENEAVVEKLVADENEAVVEKLSGDKNEEENKMIVETSEDEKNGIENKLVVETSEDEKTGQENKSIEDKNIVEEAAAGLEVGVSEIVLTKPNLPTPE